MALGPFLFFRLRQVAVRQGLKIWQMTDCAKCSMVNVPPGMKCPKKAFGIGTSEGQARFTAKVYATMFGFKECDEYVGECSTFKCMKGAKKGGK